MLLRNTILLRIFRVSNFVHLGSFTRHSNSINRYYSNGGMLKRISFIRSNQFELLKESINSTKSDLSKELIDNIRQTVISSGSEINANNFDSLFVDACILTDNFRLGKQYFLYLLSLSDNQRIGVTGKYFKLCYTFRNLCEADDFERLISLYKKLCVQYSFFDFASIEHLIEGLSITSNWREGFKLLEFAKNNTETSTRMYTPLIIAAFREKDFELGENLMADSVYQGLKINHLAFNCWLQSESDFSDTLNRMFLFYQKYSLHMPPKTAELIIEKCPDFKLTKVYQGGRCFNCSGKLSPVSLTDLEFQQLKDEFLSPVLIGKDIFLKSRPSEFQAFLNFLEKSGKIDVVLDGLNIAYSVGMKKGTASHSSTLRQVVEFLTNQNLRVMVLGRNHMKKWPRKDMSVLKERDCPVFFTDDLSQDDPLLLYAAMHNGRDTEFVSKDLMRGHKFLLNSPECKKSFEKWQQRNQIFLSYVENSKRVFFKRHVPYYIGAQKCENGHWHCPLEEPVQTGMSPVDHYRNLTWICTGHTK